MLSTADIERYFQEINKKLEERGQDGQIIMAGGAALALIYGARNLTKDIDAFSSHRRNSGRLLRKLLTSRGWTMTGSMTE